MRPSPHLDERTAPCLVQARRLLHERHRFSRDILDRGADTFGPAWVRACEETLGRLFPEPESLGLALKGYAAFAFDALRRQKEFETNPVYPKKSHQEASEEVYLNAEFMTGQYLPGLLLSHYLWPHHYRQLEFFESAFVAPLTLAETTPRFAEVGVGTGLYSRILLQRCPRAQGRGYDISPASKAFTEHHLAVFGLAGRYEVELRDVVSDPVTPVEHLICVEVLEHLEDPQAFLRTLRVALAPGGSAFITAALDAPNADHIYLYRRPEEVLHQLQEAGFILEQAWVGAAHRPAAPGLPVPLAAAFVVS